MVLRKEPRHGPGLRCSGLIISTIGLALFVRGRKMARLPALAAGLVMMIFPMFVHSLLVMWLIAGACVAGARFLPDGG